MTEYTPEFRAYARDRGRSPEDQIELDREQWPGGCMTGFILWIADRKAAFAKEHPEHMFQGGTEHIWNYAAWRDWLTKED